MCQENGRWPRPWQSTPISARIGAGASARRPPWADRPHDGARFCPAVLGHVTAIDARRAPERMRRQPQIHANSSTRPAHCRFECFKGLPKTTTVFLTWGEFRAGSPGRRAPRARQRTGRPGLWRLSIGRLAEARRLRLGRTAKSPMRGGPSKRASSQRRSSRSTSGSGRRRPGGAARAAGGGAGRDEWSSDMAVFPMENKIARSRFSPEFSTGSDGKTSRANPKPSGAPQAGVADARQTAAAAPPARAGWGPNAFADHRFGSESRDLPFAEQGVLFSEQGAFSRNRGFFSALFWRL